MDATSFSPAAIDVDWRGPMPNWLSFDPDAWGEDRPAMLPPVPLIGVGDPRSPAARIADVVVDPGGLAAIGAAIDAHPASAAALVHCLRAASGMSAEAALLVESLAFAALQGGAEHKAWLAGRPASVRHPPGDLVLMRNGDRLDLRINRQPARNAIDRAMRDALFDAFTLAALDDGIACVRLTAAGRAFGIGADLAEFGSTQDPVTAHLIRLRTLPAWPLLRFLKRGGCRFEVHVQGACIGAALELAAFADRLVAAPDAWFQLPELRMGILPGFGGTVSLPRRIGRQRAARFMLSGRRLDARAALAIGLVDAIVDDPAADDRGPDEIGG